MVFCNTLNIEGQIHQENLAMRQTHAPPFLGVPGFWKHLKALPKWLNIICSCV